MLASAAPPEGEVPDVDSSSSAAAPPVYNPQPEASAAAPPDAGPAQTPAPPAPEPPDCRPDVLQPPQRLDGLELGLDLRSPALSRDGSTLYFAASGSGVVERIFSARRMGRSLQFSAVALVAGVNSLAGDGTPVLSSDGLTLYFSSARADGAGDRDVWFAQRPNPGAAFAAPHVLQGINGPGSDQLPWLSADELTITIASTRAGGAGGSDVWIARREVPGYAFGNAEPLLEINRSSDEGRALLSKDGRNILFASDRAGGLGAQDLWMARRAEPGDPPGSVTNLADLNSPAQDFDPFLSADENELLFVSSRGGSLEIWRSRRGCD